jgi:hypothetical protein
MLDYLRGIFMLPRWCLEIWYFKILSWCNRRFPAFIARKSAHDPLLHARGSGKYLWVDEHADEYVENLRKDWD